MNRPNIIQATTLGKIALCYNVQLRTLYTWFDAYPELKTEIETHTKEVTNKGQKVLPPALVEKIFKTLGE